MNADLNRLKDVAEAEVGRLCGRLPAPLRDEALKVPVLLERVPGRDLVEEGIAPDTLGLFVGAEFFDDGGAVLPPQIFLFTENLWELAGGDWEVYRREVQTTFLHELGHYLGLDEEEIVARGLE